MIRFVSDGDETTCGLKLLRGLKKSSKRMALIRSNRYFGSSTSLFGELGCGEISIKTVSFHSCF